MPEPENSVSLLEAIVQRPGLYWGNSDNHFHSLVAFMSGYWFARDENTTEDTRRKFDDIIPSGFHEFVTEYYEHKFPYGGYGWMTFIEENTGSDREALELLLKLRRLFDEHRDRHSRPDC